MAYIANTKITVNKKPFHKGETIKGKISPAETRFLLREGYIREEKEGKKEMEKQTAAKNGGRGTAKGKAEDKAAEHTVATQ